jgi:hypothetical protein
LDAAHKGLLKKRLSTVRWLGVTCDFWSDKRLFSYLCLTGHYLTSNFDCVSTIIGFSCFPLRHYANNISKTIQEKLKELNVYEKTITITSDGASNMVKMFETLRPETRRIHCMRNREELLITTVYARFIGIAHRLHLTVCNSLGLWLKKPKLSSSSSRLTTSISESDSDSDRSEEYDLGDDDRSSPSSRSNQYSERHRDASARSPEIDDETMAVDHADDDQSTTGENTSDNELEDSNDDLVDNWSRDVLVDFDPSTCSEEQASIGTMMKKCRSFVKMLNKSSILKSYVNELRAEFDVKRTLQLDCKSRWNSSHRLLTTMLLYRKLINKLHSEKHEIKLNHKQTKKLSSIELDKGDWMLIESIERVLQPIAQATELISGRKYCTIGVSFFSLVQIREFLEDVKSSSSNDSRISSRLKQLLLFYMEQYFEKDMDQWHLIKVRHC